MCGRFNLLATPEEIAHWFRVSVLPEGLGRRYNVAPTQHIPVIRLRSGRAGEPAAAPDPMVAADRELEMMYWGLVPRWAKDPSIGSRMINARSETIDEKPAFREAFRRRRCIIIASGFYEWKKQPDGSKQPYHIRMHGGWLFGFAGLWEVWRPSPDLDPLISCTILTTAANELLAPLHHRMPVILPPQDYDTWLRGPAVTAGAGAGAGAADGDDGHGSGSVEHDDVLDALKALLVPFDAENMEAFPISRRVNNARYDDVACITPLPSEVGEQRDVVSDGPKSTDISEEPGLLFN